MSGKKKERKEQIWEKNSNTGSDETTREETQEGKGHWWARMGYGGRSGSGVRQAIVSAAHHPETGTGEQTL